MTIDTHEKGKEGGIPIRRSLFVVIKWFIENRKWFIVCMVRNHW